MARRRTPPKPITSVLISTPAPAVPAVPDGDFRRPWPWQKEAIDRLKVSSLRRLMAPTGSGKSLVIQSLALHDLAHGKKVIVAVPQLSIGRGYERDSIEVDGERREWEPAIRVDTADVRSIVRFLLEPGAASEAGRTLVCSQTALAMAANDPALAEAADPWRGVSLFLDEAHHSRTSEGSDRVRQTAHQIENSLGAIVKHYLLQESGPLTLITATWMRTDEAAIVPRPLLETFARYHRTIGPAYERS